MKGGEKHKLNTFSISEIIKAKQKEFNYNQIYQKETNSALTKTKDYSKEDNILQNTFSGKFNSSKGIKDDQNKTSNNSKLNQLLFKTSNKSYLSNNHYDNNSNSNSNSNNNNKSIHSKNLNLELKKIENILKYKEDANFNDSNYCDSRLDKISNDKTNKYTNNCGSSSFNNFNCNANNYFGNSNNFNSNLFGRAHREKSKKTFSRIQHKFKRSSMSSKFLNLYLGEIKNMSRDDLTTDNYMPTQINLNVNSLLFREKQNENNFNCNNNNNNNVSDKNNEKEFENITMLNISDSYLVDEEDLEEYSRIKINRNKYNNIIDRKDHKNIDDETNKENYVSGIDVAQSIPNVSINNITSKFNYKRNNNIIKFDANGNKLQTSINIDGDNHEKCKDDCIPNKIKKNRKNFFSKNNLFYNNNNNSIEGNEYISCLTDENQIQGKREDNTVVNLFNYLNYSYADAEINCKNSNNFNFSNFESENALLNSNNFNNNYNNSESNENNHGYCFADSGNLNKICSKSFKGSLSGISKITTNNHRNKHFYSEENNINNCFESVNKLTNVCESKEKIHTASSNKKITFSRNAYNNKNTNANENKLSNVSILSIKSDNSESGKCSIIKHKTDNNNNNTIIINNPNNKKNVILNQYNSEIDMSYYASDVDEFENTEEINKQNIYNLEVKDKLILRLNTEESAPVDNILKSNNNKNFSDCKKENSKKDFLKNFFDKEKFDYEKHNAFLGKINKNSSVKDILSIKKLNFFENDLKFQKQENHPKSSNLLLPDQNTLMNPNHNNIINLKGINKNVFFDVKDFNRKKILYRNVSKKLRTVRLSSNPSYSELGQDVTFESDKIHKIQSFK